MHAIDACNVIRIEKSVCIQCDHHDWTMNDFFTDILKQLNKQNFLQYNVNYLYIPIWFNQVMFYNFKLKEYK